MAKYHQGSMTGMMKFISGLVTEIARAFLLFCGALSTNGGTLVVLLALIMLTYAMTLQQLPKASDAFFLVLGAILGVLKGEHGQVNSSGAKLQALALADSIKTEPEVKIEPKTEE